MSNLVLPEQETQLPIHTGTNLIGSCQELVDVFVKDIGVSSMHAVIEVSPDGKEHFIEDLNSTNGTFIGNYKLSERKLYQISSGKEIIFGPTLARYELTENTEQKFQHDDIKEELSSDSLVKITETETCNVASQGETSNAQVEREVIHDSGSQDRFSSNGVYNSEKDSTVRNVY